MPPAAARRAPEDPEEEKEVQATATVAGIVVGNGTVEENILSYGTVEFPAHKQRTMTFLFEGQVTDVRVVAGESVKKGDELVRVGPMPKDSPRVQQASIDATARISGRDMGSVMEDVKARVNKLALPSSDYVEYGGLYKVQQESFQGLVLVTVAAALLVFTVLLHMYESLAAALSILLASLLAAAAVFPALWWTGIEPNITSMVGLTMIVGISAEASFFFTSQWQESTDTLAPHEALLEAGRLRLRPILMTALAAILALLPLALGVGQGSAMLQPLAVAIIAGLLFTVPAVLVALPVLVGTLTRRRDPPPPLLQPAE